MCTYMIRCYRWTMACSFRLSLFCYVFYMFFLTKVSLCVLWLVILYFVFLLLYYLVFSINAVNAFKDLSAKMRCYNVTSLFYDLLVKKLCCIYVSFRFSFRCLKLGLFLFLAGNHLHFTNWNIKFGCRHIPHV